METSPLITVTKPRTLVPLWHAFVSFCIHLSSWFIVWVFPTIITALAIIRASFMRPVRVFTSAFCAAFHLKAMRYYLAHPSWCESHQPIKSLFNFWGIIPQASFIGDQNKKIFLRISKYASNIMFIILWYPQIWFWSFLNVLIFPKNILSYYFLRCVNSYFCWSYWSLTLRCFSLQREAPSDLRALRSYLGKVSLQPRATTTIYRFRCDVFIQPKFNDS